ncbi:hypothetical protein [Schaalia vaccimaxillae]|uniref:hypothetical protein n=1 Tax=Schaalia vaccimaxillae TaxID=183916 RepID=UPI0003B5BDEE|nr:hypothetical protein [Schaalia vaccimaxillae]
MSDLEIVSGDLEAFAATLEGASEDVGALTFDAGSAITSSMPGTTCAADFPSATDTVATAQSTASGALDSIAENARLAARDYIANEAAAESALQASTEALSAVE